MKDIKAIKMLRKTLLFSRIRQYFPMAGAEIIDDRDSLDVVDVLTIDWPTHVKKPKIGIVQDWGVYPKWTKHCRFLDHNSFDYEIYNVYAHDWIEKAKEFDIILGFLGSQFWYLQEMRDKYYFLEKFLGKTTYPSAEHAILYENKEIEAYIAKLHNLQFAKTFVSHDREDALSIIETLRYPFISKIVPASGSMGVEMVQSPEQARKIVEQAFSRNGRQTFYNSFRQKNYVYFQEYVPNNGYDIRAIIVGDKWGFGYYRKVLDGDFRASGMHTEEYRQLPEEPLRICRKVNEIIKSPMLAVDMVYGQDSSYHIIEFSPTVQIDLPDTLKVNGVPGLYIFDDAGSIHFEAKRYWLHDLILAEFLLNHFLPKWL